jgi:hypothetical protein
LEWKRERIERIILYGAHGFPFLLISGKKDERDVGFLKLFQLCPSISQLCPSVSLHNVPFY